MKPAGLFSPSVALLFYVTGLQGGDGLKDTMMTFLGEIICPARFLPMVVSFMPTLARGRASMPRMLLDAQLLSINSWAMCMREFPQVEAACRHRYYVTFASSILLAAVLGTLLGYHSAVLLPATVVLGMIFVSPLFFALVLSAVPGRAERISMLLGCATIPVAHHFWPTLDLLITGFIGGSLGFAIGRALDKRGARDDAS